MAAWDSINQLENEDSAAANAAALFFDIPILWQEEQIHPRDVLLPAVRQ